MRFTDAYSACAVCSPTRAAILTGKYPARLLLTDWLPSGRWNPKARLRSGRFVRALPLEEFTLTEALREGGYQTASIGKWHLGGEPFSSPEHHGFDVNIAGNAHGAPGSYFFPYDGDWAIPTTGLRAKWNVLPDGRAGKYLIDRLTDEAVKFIGENRGRRFFLHYPHYAVHTPLQAKPEMIAEYEKIAETDRQGKPEYAAMVESVDQSVGRVLDTLKELGLTENTVVIFTSDNGGFCNATSHGHAGRIVDAARHADAGDCRWAASSSSSRTTPGTPPPPGRNRRPSETISRIAGNVLPTLTACCGRLCVTCSGSLLSGQFRKTLSISQPSRMVVVDAYPSWIEGLRQVEHDTLYHLRCESESPHLSDVRDDPNLGLSAEVLNWIDTTLAGQV